MTPAHTTVFHLECSCGKMFMSVTEISPGHGDLDKLGTYEHKYFK